MDTLEYRGETVKFFSDAEQVFTSYRGKYIEFGRMNTGYKDDMKLVIDEYLDTITRFEEDPRLWGAKLTWFQNAGFDDVKLTYRGRIVKIYLEPKFDVNDLISDAYRCMCFNILHVTPKQGVFGIV